VAYCFGEVDRVRPRVEAEITEEPCQQ